MNIFIKLIVPLSLLASCIPKASNEMEEMTHDVLQKKEGIDIKMTPIPPSKN